MSWVCGDIIMDSDNEQVNGVIVKWNLLCPDEKKDVL